MTNTILFLCLIVGHGVNVQIWMRETVYIKAHYEDIKGTPMNGAVVKITSPSGKVIRGEINEKGTFSFTPSESGKLKIEIDDGLGHGAVREIEIGKGKTVGVNGKNLPLLQKIIIGLGYVIGIFGVISYILTFRKRDKKDAHS